MIVEDYAAALKSLVTLTQTKSLVLAKITGYDISYISKWCNGIKLPATKHMEQINEKMARYFADTIRKDHKQDALYDALSIPPDTEDLTFEINQHLCAAYRASLRKSPTKSKEYVSPIKVITESHDIAKFIASLFQKELQEATGEENLLIFGEFCTLSDIGFWQYFENFTLGASRLTIRVGLDLNKLESDPKYMTRLYHMLNCLLDYDFIFYDNTELEHTNLIVLKDHFALQYSLRANRAMDMCTYIPDKVLVQDIYDRFLLCFSNQKPLIAPAMTLGMDDLGFRTAFYSANHFFFFLTNGFDFFLPHDTIDSILDKACTTDKESRQIQRLRIMWEELLSSVDVEFMLPTTSLLRYIETGYMFFTDLEYQTTTDERKAHFDNILEIMKKNPRIIMGILQSSIETAAYHESNLAFYSNLSSAFLKKHRQYVKNDASPFYIISNKRLLDNFQDSFYRLKNLPIYHQYSVEEIKEKYETYKSFISRALALNDDGYATLNQDEKD